MTICPSFMRGSVKKNSRTTKTIQMSFCMTFCINLMIFFNPASVGNLTYQISQKKIFLSISTSRSMYSTIPFFDRYWQHGK